MASNLTTLLVRLGFEDDNYRKGMSRAQQDIQNLATAGKSLTDTFGRALMTAFKATTAAFAGFGAASAVVGAQFEQEIRKVAVVAGATDTELTQLTEHARELGAVTTYSATQAANAMQALSRSGMTANEIMGATGPALMLAGASGESMTLATESLAATLAQFNLDAAESERVTDTFSIALRSSLFDLGSLRQAMKYAGTVGAAFNMTLEETVASVALFRDLGLEGSLAGTQLRMAMASAAKVSKTGEEVLAKYGMTLHDINPETNTFADILQKVGDAGMGASDAIEVFGRRTGANVANLAQSFADGTTKYNTMLSEMNSGTGTTEEMYTDMIDTVQGQFTIARSAFEELLLTIFDTYSGPLKELLEQVSETINLIADEFKNRSSEIANTVGGSFTSLGNALRANGAQIAQTFVDITVAIANILSVLARLGPLLDEIVITFAAMTAIGGFLRLVATIGQIALAFESLATVVKLVGTFLLTTGTGLGLLLGGAAAAVVGITALTVAMDENAAASKRMDDARKRSQAIEDAEAKIAEARTVRINRASEDYYNARLVELAANDLMTDSYEREIEKLAYMDEAQLQAAKARGEVVEVLTEAGRVYKTTRMLVEELNNEELDDLDATASLTTAKEQLTAQLRAKQRELTKVKSSIDQFNKAMEATGGRTAIANGHLNAYGGTIEDAREEVTRLESDVKDLTAEQDNLTRSILSSQSALAKRELDKETENIVLSIEEQAERQKEYQKKLRAAADERKSLNQEVFEDMQRTMASETQLLEMDLQERLNEVQEAADAELALLSKKSRRRVQIEQETQVALDQVRATFFTEQLEEATTFSTELLNRKREDSLSEREILRNRQIAEIAELEQHYEEVLVAAGTNSAKKLEAERLYTMALSNLMDEHHIETRDADKKRADDREKRVNAFILKAENSTTGSLADLVRERNEILAETEDDGGKTRERLNKAIQRRALSIQKKFENKTLGLSDETAARIIELEEEKQRALKEIPEQFGKTRLGVIEYYNEQIRKAQEEGEDGGLEPPEPGPWEKFKEALKKVANVFGTIKTQAEKAVGVFNDLTGTSFDLLGAVGDINDSLAERAELDAEFRAGELSPEEYQAALAELPATAAEGARDYVNELVNGAVSFTTTLIEAVPILLERFVSSLPEMMQKVVEALPVLLEGIANAIPGLVTLVAEQAPAIIDAIASELPRIIDAIGEAFTILMQNIGQIMSAIFAALPDLLISIFDNLGVILKALGQAIPDILLAIGQNIDGIIVAIIDGIMSFIASIGDFVGILVAGIVNAIPTLIDGILKSIPALIRSLIESIPKLIRSFIEAVPLILTAVINAIPHLIGVVIQYIPEIVVALVAELIPAIIAEIPIIIAELVFAIIKMFRDAFIEIGGFFAHPFDKSKRPVTETFGDTPGVIRAGGGGMVARFAPGDFIAAAQDPMDLLAQAISKIAGQTVMPAQMSMPAIASALNGIAPQAMPAMQPLRVTVTAEGRTLDDVIYRASEVGNTPKITNMIKQSTVAGAHVGFDRGRYSPSS